MEEVVGEAAVAEERHQLAQGSALVPGRSAEMTAWAVAPVLDPRRKAWDEEAVPLGSSSAAAGRASALPWRGRRRDRTASR